MRIIYNTTFIIDEQMENEWVPFMREHYVEAARACGACEDILFTKVSIDQPEGKTYSVQAVFGDNCRMEEFLERHLPTLEEALIRRYADRYVCFSSVLTEI